MAYWRTKLHIKGESNIFHINHKSLARSSPTFECPKCALREPGAISHSGRWPTPVAQRTPHRRKVSKQGGWWSGTKNILSSLLRSLNVTEHKDDKLSSKNAEQEIIQRKIMQSMQKENIIGARPPPLLHPTNPFGQAQRSFVGFAKQMAYWRTKLHIKGESNIFHIKSQKVSARSSPTF